MVIVTLIAGAFKRYFARITLSKTPAVSHNLNAMQTKKYNPSIEKMPEIGI